MVTVREVGATSRVLRKPQHTFELRTRPWQIAPFMIAPVLPGETMQSLLLQSRVVTDPIKNPLIGWWCEYYFFYVKHRDLADRDLFTAMVLDPAASIASLNTVAKVEHYHYAGSVDWVALCLDRVVDEYFRNEGETVATSTIGNLPGCSVNQQSWLDSVTTDDLIAADDFSVDLNANATITASEVQRSLMHWQELRNNNFTEMTYEQWLGTYGVRGVKEVVEVHKPELIRYVREWTYPTNHVEATTGVPSSACSWGIAERADKARYLAEPGFIFGVTVARPKVYFSNQVGSATALLNDAYTWLPATLRDDNTVSLRKMLTATGPIPGSTQAYWVDVKDLFLYGEQFVNFSLAETNAGLIALPTNAMQKRYPTAAMADAMFAAASPLNQVRQDGVVSLAISGQLQDTTPRYSAAVA